jgi:Rrf2 family protein
VDLNTKGRYAVMAMVDLAKYGCGAAIPLSAVAERQQISLAYLEQLFVRLRRAGLVESARGRAGGYRLMVSPDRITVAEVMAAVEEDVRMTRCAGEDGMPCLAGSRCLTHGLWEALGSEISRFLSGISLQDVLDDVRLATPSAGRLPATPQTLGDTVPATQFGGQTLE